jgi:hypothetical protein
MIIRGAPIQKPTRMPRPPPAGTVKRGTSTSASNETRGPTTRPTWFTPAENATSDPRTTRKRLRPRSCSLWIHRATTSAATTPIPRITRLRTRGSADSLHRRTERASAPRRPERHSGTRRHRPRRQLPADPWRSRLEFHSQEAAATVGTGVVRRHTDLSQVDAQKWGDPPPVPGVAYNATRSCQATKRMPAPATVLATAWWRLRSAWGSHATVPWPCP